VRWGKGERRKVRTPIHLSIFRVSLRFGRFASVSLFLLSSLTGRVSAAVEHDVTVLVLATGPEADRVAISYSHVVNHSQLAAGAVALARAAGVKTGEVAIREEPVWRGSQERATSAEFAAPGLVRGRSGPLPVEAIARSLPDWRRMRLVFAVGEKYQFAGPESGEAAEHRIELVNQAPTAYQYDVERIGRGEQASGEAEGEGEASGAPGGGAVSLWRGIRLALIGLSAAAAGVAIWILVRTFRTKD
jgi:hypothetical protein